MRTFQAICVALAVAASRGQLLSYGAKYGTGISYGHAAPALATVRTASYVHAAPAVATVAAAPVAAVHHVTQHRPVFAAAPIAARVAVAAAPVAVAAAPVHLGVVAHAPARGLRTHEVHTSSGRQAIRIEEFQAGNQVIRVHEAPQAAPQIAQVHVPGQQDHVRVINHQAGPAHVERLVHRQPTQVIDVQKPGRPGARIVQVVRGHSPAPSIEFVNAGGSDHHVYHAHDHHAAPALAVAHTGPALAAHAAPALAVHAAPAFAVHAAPVISRGVAVHHAPAVATVHHAAPALALHHAAPSAIIGGASYGSSHGSHFGSSTAVLH